MQNKETIYSYLIQILTLAKLYKAEIALGKKAQNLDKIINLILKALDDFEELDTLNPHQNLALKYKLIAQNKDGEYLIEDKKGKEILPEFSPSLNLNFKEDLDRYLNKNLANLNYVYKITNLINLAELKENNLVTDKVTHPIYLLTIKLTLNSSRIIGKGFKFMKDVSNLNKLDKYILSEEN